VRPPEELDATPATGAFDLVDGAEVAAGVVQLSGWLLHTGGSAGDAVVLVGDATAVPVSCDVDRPDVARAFPTVPGAVRSGWTVSVDLGASPSGRVDLALVARRRSGAWSEVCRSHLTVVATGPDPRKERAAFTIVQNEPQFLPLWYRFYRAHFAEADLFVLDHGSTDGTTSALRGTCNVVPVHRSRSFDHEWLRSTVAAFQRFLLQSYEVVLFAEVDELVLPDPARFPDLASYVAQWHGPAARCTGFNVTQEPGEEALAFDAPILAQRRWWHRAPLYDKTLLARRPLGWSVGFHSESTARVDPDPDLLLVHLHRVDYSYCLDRHRAAAARPWNELDLAAGHGWQNRVTETDEFRTWYFHGSDLGGAAEPISEAVRGAL
jgi:hypothetical protein